MIDKILVILHLGMTSSHWLLIDYFQASSDNPTWPRYSEASWAHWQRTGDLADDPDVDEEDLGDDDVGDAPYCLIRKV